ncbi:MAG: AAA family ATPase [Burkholderiales bacterium]|nr:AAA family ATPase [Burkholderiales bacterium]
MSTSPPPDQVARVQRLRERLRDGCRAEVACIETHISWVLVTPTEAFKLKKAVDLGFIDQREAPTRRQACEDEVRLNRRTAPELYLGVRAIDADGAWVDVDAPQAVDHAVHMRRFEPQRTLDVLLAQPGLASAQAQAWVDELVDQVAQLHATAAVVREPDLGLLADLRRVTGERPEQWLALCHDEAERQQVGEALHWLADQEARWAELSRSRREAGFVRELHGDLHLGNVCLFDGRVTVFDAIEFNRGLRTIDTLNDLAFLLMDLHVQGHHRLAWRALSRYLDATGDHAGVPLLDGFMVWRALVRFKVARLRGGEPALDVAQDPARRCLRGIAWLMRPRTPVLVGMHGVSGCGKSAVSERLLSVMGAIRLRSDVERRRLPDGAGEGRYTSAAREATLAFMLHRAEALLRAGHRVILDATFLAPTARQALRTLAQRVGCRWAWVQCDAPLDVMLARLAVRQGDPSEADAQVLMQQLQRQHAGDARLDELDRAHAMHCATTLPLSHWDLTASWVPLWRLLDLDVRPIVGPAMGPERLDER